MADVPDGGEGGVQVAFLRDLCHELRQPLVVVMGYVSMLEEGSFGALSAEMLAILHTVQGRLDALSAIIDRVADETTSGGAAGRSDG